MGSYKAVVRLLIERDDVDINAKVSLAAENGHDTIVRLLNDRCDMRTRDSYIVTRDVLVCSLRQLMAVVLIMETVLEFHWGTWPRRLQRAIGGIKGFFYSSC